MRNHLALILTLSAAPASAQTFDLAADDNRVQRILGADGRRADLADEVGDNLFGAVSGDLDGDHVPDLALIAQGDDGPDEARFDAGAILVFFGPIEPGGVVDLRAQDADLIIHGATAGEGLGLSDVVIGDLDHDGDDDLVFGSEFASPPGRTQAGEVLAFFGPLAPGVIDLQVTPADWSLLGRDGTQTSLKGDRTHPAGIADVDGDGFNDLVVAAWLGAGPANARELAGELLILFGGQGSVLAGPAALDVATLTDHFIAYGAETRDAIDVVAVADLDGDGVADVVFSDESNGPANDRDLAGSVGVLRGGSHLRPAAGAIRERDLAAQPPELLIHGAEAFDFVRSAAVGDVDGDGAADMLVGAWFASGPGNTRPGAGETYLLLGAGALGAGSSPLVIDLATPGSFDAVIHGADEGDLSGVVVAATNANGDVRDDVVINSPFADGPGNARPDAGEVHVVFGLDVFPAAIDLRDPADLHFIGVESGLPNNDEDPGDTLFFDGAADLNQDGLDELMLSAPRADGPLNERPRAGEAYLFFPGVFLRGDVDGDGDDDFHDVVRLFHRVLHGTPIPCDDAGDVDDSGALDLADAFRLLVHVFFGYPTVAAPHPACGVDPTPDDLGCSSSSGCDRR